MFISVKKVVRICSIVLFLTLVARTSASAQETRPNLSIEFLSNQQVSNVNFEQASFEVHAESVVKTLEAYFSDFEKAHEIVVLETFSSSVKYFKFNQIVKLYIFLHYNCINSFKNSFNLLHHG